MTENKEQVGDIAAEKELEGVPEHLKADTPADDDAADKKIAELEQALAAAKQDVLYAQAETQNVRRRMEKEAADARAYAATGFARDILSVSDNLTRALEAIPAELREDEKMKAFSPRTASPASPPWACRLIPTSIRQWLKSRAQTPNPALSLQKCRRGI
jgi:molecular chaperone GrpE